MIDVCDLAKFTASGKILRLVMDIAAALERYKLVKSCIFHFVFETVHPFPDGNGRMGCLWQTAILGKWNSLFLAAPVENMVLCHQRQYYRALHTSQVNGDAAPFVEFMLGIILRTVKARGVPKGGKKKVVSKGGKKTADLIMELVSSNPRITFAEMVARLQISRSAIQKHITHLKDAQRLRRIGPDKGGHWEIVR